MTAFLMAAVPCRIRFFFASSTVDLAGRSGCYTLRAILRKRTSPCGFHAPAFRRSQSRIKPLPSDAGRLFAI
jgi:hypothetical protein